ncbi:MAG TPA: aminoacyl-histidine dipeptidase [Bacteroidales bacterium]|nr:aminoacyl-histidine dipeptidase [Bacteroidales bacterium]HSA43505.1 aminoacyl-histidine dipeptidase [Bacteroidales bacterium]
MNEEILNLQPAAVWAQFRELLGIPRPSGKEGKVTEFVRAFGESLGLHTIVDEVGNVIIRKPATPGMENRMGVVLQGHLDMVPQKNSGIPHQFDTDPIRARIDGEWVKATDTTLGADNGMGVAAAMAVLASGSLRHGPVEGLFTVDEESGMTGAFNLKPGLLEGDILMNLDSEDEGELYVGCAGGTNANIAMAYGQEAVPADYQAFNLIIKGLKGGHSGLDIHLGRGNANKLVFRYLKHAAREHGLRIASYEGGNLRNAIPREAFALVVVAAAQAEALQKCVEKFASVYQSELSVTEPELYFGIEPAARPEYMMEATAQKAITHAIIACPNGVIRMSDTMPGLVETSTNLSIVKISDGKVAIQCLMRSSVDSAREDLGEMIHSAFSLAGADVTFDGSYPGWKPNPASPILNVMKEVYGKHFGRVPEIKAIHAGLECGLLGGVYPHWDMISFGPTIRYPHSPDEKVHIPSVAKFWDFLVKTLENIPEKK